MPGTSKNFEGGSGAEVWLSCEHRSFSWLIIFTSEFNLPFFFFSLFDPPSIDTVARFRPSRCIWCIQFWATLSWWGKLQCWDRDSLWSSQHAPFPLESPWCEHLGALGSPWFISTLLRLRCFGWGTYHCLGNFTHKHSMQCLLFSEWEGRCWEISTLNPLRGWTHFLATKPWTLSFWFGWLQDDAVWP